MLQPTECFGLFYDFLLLGLNDFVTILTKAKVQVYLLRGTLIAM